MVGPDENYPEDEIDYFYENYIMNWIPAFCDTLQNASSFSYYKDIANNLKEDLYWLS